MMNPFIIDSLKRPRLLSQSHDVCKYFFPLPLSRVCLCKTNNILNHGRGKIKAFSFSPLSPPVFKGFLAGWIGRDIALSGIAKWMEGIIKLFLPWSHSLIFFLSLFCPLCSQFLCMSPSHSSLFAGLGRDRRMRICTILSSAKRTHSVHECSVG